MDDRRTKGEDIVLLQYNMRSVAEQAAIQVPSLILHTCYVSLVRVKWSKGFDRRKHRIRVGQT